MAWSPALAGMTSCPWPRALSTQVFCLMWAAAGWKVTPSASLDTLQSLPRGAVTLRAFNSRSRMQREAVNSQIIPSPGMLLASRPPSLLLYTHLSLGSGDRSEAGSEGGWKGLPISAHTTGFWSIVWGLDPRGETWDLRACQKREASHTHLVSVEVTQRIPNAEATKFQTQNNL